MRTFASTTLSHISIFLPLGTLSSAKMLKIIFLLLLGLKGLAWCSIDSEQWSDNVVETESDSIRSSECHLRPVVHILQHPGCVPKPIPSFACYGTCSSYVQVSNSKFWEVERSCNCCQEIGEREASVTLYCPGQMPKHRKVTTRAPVDCLCRPCSAVDAHQVKPQEIHDISG